MITKGRAFLTHPYWISDDDKYYADFFNENGCDSYQLAEEIYAEKVGNYDSRQQITDNRK
jgi:hypothetical protein